MTGSHARGDAIAALAAHATALAFGFLLAAPVLLARHPQAPLPASATTPAAQDWAGTHRNPMAFEPAGSAVAEGPTGSLEWAPVPVAAAVRPAVAPGTGGIGVQAIYAVFGQSPGLGWALRVAHCESRYNPLAINRSSGASGLFQFMPSTWNAHFAGWNIWDPYAQARAALSFYNQGATNAWTCK